MNNIAVYLLNELFYIQHINFEPIQSKLVLENILDSINKVFTNLNWDNLTLEQAKDLGFRRWTNKEDIEEDIASLRKSLDSNEITKNKYEKEITKLKNTIDLYLIPVYLANFIPKDIKLTDIFGNDIINKGNIDKDSRMGCLSIGLKFKSDEANK